MFRLDEKLARIRAGAYRRSDFIIADAKDPDMGPGLHSVGPKRERDGTSKRFRTRAEFIDSIVAVLEQDALRKQGVTPHRDLAADNQITEAVLQLG
jgi:hypothetical protein